MCRRRHSLCALVLLSVAALPLLLGAVAWAGAVPLSWCDAELCAPDKPHIGCNNTAEFHARCPSDAVLVDLKPYRNFILDEHNKRRNFIAYGLLPGYYPAAHMASMRWDSELEYLAALNLKTCILDHDKCLNTHRFRNAGQNLVGVHRSRHPTAPVTDLVEQALYLWFSEFAKIDNSYINKFRVVPPLDNYGHFAEAVLDRNTHVGCAMMRFTRPDYPHLFIYNTACNYGSIYAIDQPVYKVGEPASECRTGSNPKYPALCSDRENINPNLELY